jgi:DNA-binding transcriptional LysR family regulator
MHDAGARVCVRAPKILARMQLKWLDDLVVLERTRSFSRAAEVRHITQSALSRRIRSLEAWAGTLLVDRNTFPLTLTTAGKAFCGTAREALGLLVEARAAMRRDTMMPGNAIEIAAGHALSLTFLPAWLKECREQMGMFSARVVAANVLDAVVALSEGSCDLMLGYWHTRVPVSLDPERFVRVLAGHDRLIPVSVPDASGDPHYALDRNNGEPIPFLAYTAATTLGKVVDTVLEETGVHRGLVPCYEADMAFLLLKLAREGHGVAWLPESSAAESLATGALVRAGGSQWTAELEIHAYRPRRSENATLLALWDLLTPAAEADAYVMADLERQAL